MNSLTVSILMLFLSVSSTEARFFRSRKDSTTSSSSRQHQQQQQQQEQILTDYELSVINGEIHAKLHEELREHQDMPVNSLQQDVSGLAIYKQQGQGPCFLNGNIIFQVESMTGLEHYIPTSLQPVEASEIHYEPIHDFRGRIKGYYFNGLWNLSVSYNRIDMEILSAAMVNVCGSELDLTAHGQIRIDSTQMDAVLSIQGSYYFDSYYYTTTTSENQAIIEFTQVVEDEIHFQDSTMNLSGLTRHLPLPYQQEVEALVKAAFESRLKKNSNSSALITRSRRSHQE